MPTLTVESLRKSYRARTVVEDVTLHVRGGEIVGLLGPNGAGKTTVFYMIVGLTGMDAGHIDVDGINLSRASMHQRARAGIGYLPQQASIFRRMSAEHNISAILELRNDLDRAAQHEVLESLLTEFGLQHVRRSLGENLSGGERRRVEVARALASKPAFMLLDEPFAGIDPLSVADIKDQMRALARHGVGVLVTDHNVRDTLDICDRAYIISAGRIIAEGSPPELVASPLVRRVYLGEGFRL